MASEIRVLVTGDAGVGKSSVITAFVKRRFVPVIQHVLPEISVPPESTPLSTPLLFLDCPQISVESAAKKSHVVMLVCALGNELSLERITSHWLPLLLPLGLPIVLVANMSDLGTVAEFPGPAAALRNKFPLLDAVIECSAKTGYNIDETIYRCQNAHLYPCAPLYDRVAEEITHPFAQALRRIFHILSTTSDCLCAASSLKKISTTDLNYLQGRCFKNSLSSDELGAIERVASKSDPRCAPGEITFEAFCHLHLLLLQNDRTATSWIILFEFGYDKSLAISREYLYPTFKYVPSFVYQLSNDAMLFLEDQFTFSCEVMSSPCAISDLNTALMGVFDSPHLELSKACKDHVGYPDNLPRIAHLVSAKNTLASFLSLWAVLAHFDPASTYAALAYLGYDSGPSEAFNRTERRHTPNRSLWSILGLDTRPNSKTTTRNTFSCLVFGSSDSGKALIFEHLLAHRVLGSTENSSNIGCSEARPCSFTGVSNAIQYGDQEYFLGLVNVNLVKGRESAELDKLQEECDLACLAFDSTQPQSVKYLSRVVPYIADGIIVVLVDTAKNATELEGKKGKVFFDSLGLKTGRTIRLFSRDRNESFLKMLIAPIIKRNRGTAHGVQPSEFFMAHSSVLAKYFAFFAVAGAICGFGVAAWKQIKPLDLLRRRF